MRILCSILLPAKYRAVYEIIWQKYGSVRQATDNNVMRHVPIACWIPSATNTHTVYEILVAFPRQ